MSIVQTTLDWDTKLEMIIEKLPEVEGFQKSTLYVVVDAAYRTLQALLKYDDNYEKLTPKTTLIRSSIKVLPFPDDFRVQQVRVLTSMKGDNFLVKMK